jgi:hypothetical protein
MTHGPQTKRLSRQHEQDTGNDHQRPVSLAFSNEQENQRERDREK